MNPISFPILKSKVSLSSLKMFLHYILSTFLILFPNFSQNELTIEISYSEDPLTYTCDLIDFPEEQFVKCLCITGLWAFSISSVNKPSKWRLIGDTGDPKCLEMGEWVKRMEKISDSSQESKLSQLGNSDIVAIANEGSWEIQMGKGKFCLPGAIPKGYCLYRLDSKGKIPGDQIQQKCSQDSKVLKPMECHSFDPSEYEIDPEDFYGCKIVSNIKNREHFRLNRVKREGESPKATTRKPFNKVMLDEDYISPTESANYMGEMPMIESITDYMLSNVIDILELNAKSRRKRSATAKNFIPPVDLLRVMGSLLKKMCPSIKSDIFTLAEEVFLSHQRTVFQIKEPYIAYAPYKRILNSLEECTPDAQPFKFIQNLTTPNETEVVCLLQNPPTTSFHIIRGTDGYDAEFQVDQTVDIPRHAASDPNYHEPIVEIAWKMFVIPHNHCYFRFVNYNNDHHTLTTTLLPYFSNQIQNIWLLSGTAGGNVSWGSNTSALINYTTEYIWYNNLLGNISELYSDLNHCYSASKIQKNSYPWFLNRPNLDLTNQWSRRRRDAGSGTSIAGEHCLQNPADFL